MTNVLILGGYGIMGRHISKLLLDNTDVNIILAGRDEKKLLSYSSELDSNRVSTQYIDVSNYNDCVDKFNNVDIVVNTTPTLDLQEQIKEAILKTKCDFFDVHSPSKYNYTLFEDCKNIDNQTIVLDCGATAFLPFLELASKPFTKVDFVSYYKIYWQKHGFTKATELEHEKMLFENLTEDCVYKNKQWFKESDNLTKQFEYGTGIAMLNGDTKLAVKKYPNINEIGYYVITDSQEKDTIEHTCLSINTCKETIKVFQEDGWYLAAVMAVSGIIQHLTNKKAGTFLLGEFVSVKEHCKLLEDLGLTIQIEERSLI